MAILAIMAIMNYISATQLKNNIADVLDEVRFKGTVTIVERHGKPVAKIVPIDVDRSDSARLKANLMKLAGAWKGTELDNDDLWKDVLKRKSRRKSISL